MDSAAGRRLGGLRGYRGRPPDFQNAAGDPRRCRRQGCVGRDLHSSRHLAGASSLPGHGQVGRV